MPYDNAGFGPLRVPGCGMGLQAALDKDSLRQDPKRVCYFADGIEGWSGPRLTVRELAMLRLTESITDKPDWDKKVFDDTIVGKWRAEAMSLPLISELAWDWVLKELRDKATAFKTSHRVLALDSTARCVKSDSVVSLDVKAELIGNTAPLFSLPEEERDWHPGSNHQVLNLVHPSLHPLVYGRTRVLMQGGRVFLPDILASCGKGQVAPQTEQTVSSSWSRRFQWLPCEVEFVGDSEDDTNVRITSYINNLHPAKHGPLYRTIEKVIGLSVPLWNNVVMYKSYRPARTPLRIVTYGAEWAPPMPEWTEYGTLPSKMTDDNFAETMRKVKEYLALPDRPGPYPDNDEDEEDDEEDEHERDPETICAALEARLVQVDAQEAHHDWDFKGPIERVVERKWKRHRFVAHPEPSQAFTYEEWKKGVQKPIIPSAASYGGSLHSMPDSWLEGVSLQTWFRDQGLQVIVKLASIELTPQNPTYTGGSWHLEGMKNEKIVATSIYYYDVQNTTMAHLSFRQGADLDDMELQYEQDDHQPLSTVFGTASMNSEPAVQVIGRVSTPEGRLLAFPNTLQHKVGPFELADKTKPGHRRFLVLWLVDPHFRICSTRNVPPQQHSWWAEAALDAVNFGPLPQELVDMIKGEIEEWPMGLQEAKELRLDLMAERTTATESVENTFEQYNLCEH